MLLDFLVGFSDFLCQLEEAMLLSGTVFSAGSTVAAHKPLPHIKKCAAQHGCQLRAFD